MQPMSNKEIMNMSMAQIIELVQTLQAENAQLKKVQSIAQYNKQQLEKFEHCGNIIKYDCDDEPTETPYPPDDIL